MKYETLNTLNIVLNNLQSDAATVGLSIASIMIIVSAILIMFDTDTSVGAHSKHREQLQKVFLCAALIAAAGALVTFGQQLGGMIKPG